MNLPDNIHSRLRLTYIALATVPLLLVGLILTWTTYANQQSQAIELQAELARRMSTFVLGFIEGLEANLRVTARISNLTTLDREQQENIFRLLQGAENNYTNLSVVNPQGKEISHVSYLDIISEGDLRDFTNNDEYKFIIANPETPVYYSPVYPDPFTNAPLMTIAIPLVDNRTRDIMAILVAEVSLKEISNIIASVNLESGQTVFIVNESKVIAHNDPSVVLSLKNYNVPSASGINRGLDNSLVAMGIETIQFGDQKFDIVTETPLARVFSLAFNSWLLILGLVIITTATAILLAVIAANHITRPIQSLANTAEAIREGDLSQQAETSGLKELDTLANTFNSMTAQLRHTLEGLEHRVAVRTQALKTSAEVSRSLTTILETDKLVREVATQIQSAFNYYHVNIYLLEQATNDLILVAGTGTIREQITDDALRIPIGKGILGETAKKNACLLIPDVTKYPAWQASPWLPETKAELVVPIARGELIVGVLDIQHNMINSLKEEDSELMQTIANQLAVALLNAQSFEQLVAEKLAEGKQKEEVEKRLEAYRKSPIGQAEEFAKKLLASPEISLTELHNLAQTAGKDSDASALLSHLPRLMDETQPSLSNQKFLEAANLAKMAEGFYYLYSSQNAPELLLVGLRTLTYQLERPSVASWKGFAKAAEIYKVCRLALEVRTIAQITELDWKHVSDETITKNFILKYLIKTLAEFRSVIEALNAYERVNAIQDKLTYLVAAVERLRHIEREARKNLGSADVSIVLRIAETWQAIVTGALSELQTQARINFRLVTRHTLHNDMIALILNVNNDGRGAAINVKVKVLPGQDYTLVEEITEIKQLVPGGEEQVTLYIRPHPKDGNTQFRVRFAVEYDDPRGPSQTEHFADIVHLVREQAEFHYIPNPYVVGTPLEPGSSLFFGREELLAAIEANLAAAHRNNLVLIGQRRMGKTSLLKQLRHRLGKLYTFVYLDGQVMGLDPGMSNFFLNIATEIAFALEDQGFEISLPNPEVFETTPANFFEFQFLPDVFNVIGDRHLIILFDEFEELEVAVRRGHLETSIFGYLRHLMQHVNKISFIFCGTHRLEELGADYWSVLFNISLYKKVGNLSLEEALRLIQRPVENFGMQYDDLSLDKMWRVTSGHPYFLQLLCHSLVNIHNKEKSNYVTVADINTALNEILSSGEAHFIYLWTASSSDEKLVLIAISRSIPLTGSINAVQVGDFLSERGMRLERRKIRESLHRLTLREILKMDEIESAGENIYRWQLGLLGLWVEKYKSLSQVMDEVTV